MKVRRKRYASGKIKWEADLGIVNGRRVQRYYDTQEAAKAAVKAAKDKLVLHGHAALSLSEEERIRFCGARDRLAVAGATIEEAVDFYLAHRKRMREVVTLADLAAKVLLEKELERKRDRYVTQLGVSFRAFTAGRETLPAHEVTREMVQEWIRSCGWAPKTQRGYLGDVKMLFAWACEKGHAFTNPCAGVTVPEGEREEIEFLTAREAERLLNAALSSWDRRSGRCPFVDLLGYVAIGLFGGVRPEELQRSPVTVLNMEESTVIVMGRVAKSRQRRPVDLSPNAMEWLRLWRRLCPEQKMIIPVNFRNRWRRLREACGFLCERDGNRPGAVAADRAKSWPRPWPHDAMRHTFATMHYATHQKEDVLQAQMGHESAKMLFANYRGLTTRKEAERFWAIRPPAIALPPLEMSWFSPRRRRREVRKLALPERSYFAAVEARIH